MPTARPIHKILPCFAIALGWVSLDTAALASGFATARFGGEHGNPITSNPTAIYYNPSGLAESEGIHIFADANIAFRSATYDHKAAPSDAVEPNGAIGANTGKATLFNVVAAPMLGASAKFGNLAVGAGFYVPIGGTSVWDKDKDFENSKLYAGPVDGEQRWYSIEGTIRSIYLSAAAAYKFPGIGLSLGLALNLIDSNVHTIRARTAAGDNDLDQEGRSLVDVSGIAWGFGVGAMYEAVPKKLWLGASYQSRPNVAGGMHLDGTLTNNFGTPEAPVKVTVNQDLPDIYRLGVRFKATDKVELRLFGDLTRWSAFKNQCLNDEGKDCEVKDNGAAADENNHPIQNLPRRWRDAGGVRAGVSYWVVPKLEAFGGLGFDSNAIPDENLDPALTDFTKFSVALGGRVEVVKQFHVAASWTQFLYLSRDTNGKSKNAAYELPSKGPDAGGEYTQNVGVLNINLEASF